VGAFHVSAIELEDLVVTASPEGADGFSAGIAEMNGLARLLPAAFRAITLKR
jgi:hypothetical protein